MAVSLNLITFSGGTVTPKTDGIIYDSAIGQCGVFYGCNVTANGNTVYVSSGYGIIRGRFFEINDSSVAVTLSSSATLSGRIYLRLDLSNTTEPLQLLVASGSTLPDLTQEEDANFTNGVWEMELATFEITTSAIENVTETFATIEDNNSRNGKTRFTFSSSVSSAQGVLAYGFKDNSTKTVRVYFTARFSSNVGANVSMFSIPEDYRPSDNNGGPCIVTTDTGASVVGYATIGADGTVKQAMTGYCRGIVGFAEYEL